MGRPKKKIEEQPKLNSAVNSEFQTEVQAAFSIPAVVSIAPLKAEDVAPNEPKYAMVIKDFPHCQNNGHGRPSLMFTFKRNAQIRGTHLINQLIKEKAPIEVFY